MKHAGKAQLKRRQLFQDVGFFVVVVLFCFLGQGGFVTKSRGPGDSPDPLTSFLSFGRFRSAAQCRSLSSGSFGSLASARVSAADLFYSRRRVVTLSGYPKDRSISDRLFVIAVMFLFGLGSNPPLSPNYCVWTRLLMIISGKM